MDFLLDKSIEEWSFILIIIMSYEFSLFLKKNTKKNILIKLTKRPNLRITFCETKHVWFLRSTKNLIISFIFLIFQVQNYEK